MVLMHNLLVIVCTPLMLLSFCGVHSVSLRVGVGYATPAEQQKGSAILVLANDAHSWAELYIEELGWVILDIAPQTVLDEMGEGPDMEMLDALEELARAEPDSQFRRAINWRALWNQYRGYLLNGIGLALTTCGVWLVIYKVRRRRTYRSKPTPYWVYVSALDALSEQGWARRKGETRSNLRVGLRMLVRVLLRSFGLKWDKCLVMNRQMGLFYKHIENNFHMRLLRIPPDGDGLVG